MAQHLELLALLFVGVYLFLLGMGVPLPPKDFKRSKSTGVTGLVFILITAALLPSGEKPVLTPAGLVAQEMKKKMDLPIREKEGLTVIDITSEDETNALVYVYRIGKGKDEAQELASRMGKKMEEIACQNKDFVTMLKNGISIINAYQDEDGRPVGRTIIRPRMCHL